MLSIFGRVIGNLLGEEHDTREETISVHFQPGYLMDSGISWVQYFRRALVAGLAIGAGAHSVKCDRLCRASELPLYTSDENKKPKNEKSLCPPKPGVIEGTIGSVRRQIWEAMDQCAGMRRDVEDCYEKGRDYASSMFTYLSEECDETTRMGAVGIGAVTGFILGIRGGMIRRLFYSGVGAYGMSAVCYPKQTAQYTQVGITESRKYATIAYNFAFGVKKDDIPLPHLPKLPSSMGEVWDMAGELGKSASSFITGSTDTPTDKPVVVAIKSEEEGKIKTDKK